MLGSMSFSDGRERWWLQEATTHDSVWAAFNGLYRDHAGRNERLNEYRGLYEDVGVYKGRKHRYTFNVVRSCIDTLCAKVSKARPRPLALTTEGDWKLQRKAKLLTQYLDGMFRQMRLYPETQRAFRDACIYDIGIVKVWVETDPEDPTIDGRICAERIMPDEVWVDPAESYYGQPRTIYHRKQYDREQLAAMFPAARLKIQMAASSNQTRHGIRVPSTMVDVLEAWHLPSRDGASDGKHTIVIDNATLLSEPYEDPFFPFVEVRLSESESVGYYGTGLAEQLRGLQKEITIQLDNIRTAHRRLGRPFVWLKTGSQISKADLTNEIGAIIEGQEAPVFGVTTAMNPEVYNWVRELVQRAYQITGISETSARSQKPAGVESGVAIREVSDIETERFVIVAQAYEEMHMEIARRIIHYARRLYEDGVSLKVNGVQGKFLRSITWREVDMEQDEFSLQIYPTSLLPTRPEGRLERVTEMINAGMIDKSQGLKYLDVPDVEDATTLATAALDDARMVVDHMLDGGEYVPPEPFMDLKLAAQVAQSAYLRARTRGAPEAALDKLRSFMADVQALVKLAAPPPPPAAPAAPPAPDAGAPPPAVPVAA